MASPRAAYAVGLLAVSALAVAAARAEAQLPATTTPRVLLAVGVGVGFVVAGATAQVALLPRALAAGTGVAWIVASLEPVAQRLHQGLLLLMLLAFASGRLRGAADRLVGLAAVAVALLLVPQPAVIAIFAVVAGLATWRARTDRVHVYGAMSAASLSAVLGVAWVLSRRSPSTYRPGVALVAYEVVLLAIAVGMPIAARAAVAHRARLTDRVLGSTVGTGVDGLARVLRTVLHDPALRIRTLPIATSTHLDTGGRPADPAPAATGHRLEVRDDSSLLAVVEHGSSLVHDDALTAGAVTSAVRLVRLHELRQDQRRAELKRLTEARSRLVASRDHQRAMTASRLRGDVVRPLVTTADQISGIRLSVTDPDARAALGVVVAELRTTTREVLDLVAGVPPADLGQGRLVGAARDLAARSSVPVRVVTHGRPTADAAVESALFYVCSEALANAAKHARATTVAVGIRELGSVLEVAIQDDGVGGADPRGSGLQGLADRLAVLGGRLDVRSVPGAGTTVTGSVGL